MTNPWLSFPTSAPYVLPEDRAHVDSFNARLRPGNRCRIAVESVIPEPFIGAVGTAPVVVLQLNPGFHPIRGPVSHANTQFRQALFANLHHFNTEWPFYFFDPQFEVEAPPGSIWWKGKMAALAKEIPFRYLAHRLAVVEWFPYHSERYKDGCILPSQDYGFSLVADAIDRDALIVIARGVERLENSVAALKTYRRKLTLSSVQNVTLSPNNLKFGGEKTPKAWEMLISALS